jgi:hypothetical protein
MITALGSWYLMRYPTRVDIFHQNQKVQMSFVLEIPRGTKVRFMVHTA